MIYFPEKDMQQLSAELVDLKKSGFTLNTEGLSNADRSQIHNALWAALQKVKKKLRNNKKAKIQRRLEKL